VEARADEIGIDDALMKWSSPGPTLPQLRGARLPVRRVKTGAARAKPAEVVIAARQN
jgi:hypothetical protein